MRRVGDSIKGFFVSIWGFIKRIRQTPSWCRASILFILYTFATKPLEMAADKLSTMHNLISTNITYIVETIKTDSKDFWEVILYIFVIAIFVMIATWLFGDNDNKKEKQELKETMKKDKEEIIEEIRKGRLQ
jgi:phosphotransferase system  glucose/maltose/N-acetylglucosamine-specific IIC component